MGRKYLGWIESKIAKPQMKWKPFIKNRINPIADAINAWTITVEYWRHFTSKYRIRQFKAITNGLAKYELAYAPPSDETIMPRNFGLFLRL